MISVMHSNEARIKAVELVRGIREAHYARHKDLTPEEKIAFFREKANALYAELGRPGPCRRRSGRLSLNESR